jgi:hypothetical protein
LYWNLAGVTLVGDGAQGSGDGAEPHLAPVWLRHYFKISIEFWRITAATFHMVFMIYSMIILIGLYIYQV